MATVPLEIVSGQEISNRVHLLQMRYAGNPLVKGIDYRIGFDWSDDPAVFIDVMLNGNANTASELQRLAEDMRFVSGYRPSPNPSWICGKLDTLPITNLMNRSSLWMRR